LLMKKIGGGPNDPGFSRRASGESGVHLPILIVLIRTLFSESSGGATTLSRILFVLLL
jgi:hypothetical protein